MSNSGVCSLTSDLCSSSQPQDIQKSVLKGIINSLLREWKG